MNTIKTLGFAGAGSFAIALLVPYMSLAGMSPAATANSDAGSSSLVHRVSHSLADGESYTSTGPVGYKWGRKVEQSSSKANWDASTTARGGYKWGNSSASETQAPSYAGTTAYNWGVQSYAEQAGYRWGVNKYADQAGYRWGVNK